LLWAKSPFPAPSRPVRKLFMELFTRKTRFAREHTIGTTAQRSPPRGHWPARFPAVDSSRGAHSGSPSWQSPPRRGSARQHRPSADAPKRTSGHGRRLRGRPRHWRGRAPGRFPQPAGMPATPPAAPWAGGPTARSRALLWPPPRAPRARRAGGRRPGVDAIPVPPAGALVVRACGLPAPPLIRAPHSPP